MRNIFFWKWDIPRESNLMIYNCYYTSIIPDSAGTWLLIKTININQGEK